MKEYDLEAARRKFLETVLIYKNQNQQLTSGFCFQINQESDKIIYYINNRDNIESTEDPIYHEIKNGFYLNPKENNSYLLIKRRPQKTFKIGANQQTHEFLKIVSRTPEAKLNNSNTWATTQLQTPLILNNDWIEKAMQFHGPIGDKFWLNETSVYYLTKKIGSRKGTNFVVNKLFKPYIQQYLRDFNINLIS